MRLNRARVTKFRGIDDSGWVDFCDVTCMVGKNESGKTAFLEALGRLRPVPGQPGGFDPVFDYPSKEYGAYRRKHAEKPAVVVQAEYSLSAAEEKGIENTFGAGALSSETIS